MGLNTWATSRATGAGPAISNIRVTSENLYSLTKRREPSVSPRHAHPPSAIEVY